MNMFNTDSGFRPPSPLPFSGPSHGLFGEPLSFDDFKLSNQDFLNLPTSPPPLGADPSMQLFNPSEQRYFSEFLDTLVVDQDFTFDPSAIPNLPNLPLFTPETMPGSFVDNPYMLNSASSASSLANPGLMNSMDFDMTSPSSQSSFGHSLPNHFGHGFPSSPQLGESPVSPSSPSGNNSYTIAGAVSVPTKRKTNKSTDRRKGTSISSDSSKISTPIQQLSKLSLNNNNSSSSNGNSNGDSHGPSNPKKNKRDEDEHPTSSSPVSSPSNSRGQKESSRERNASYSDGSVSDAANSTPNPTTPATTKRKPYKELLTEEEKRANHIASEQKRRNTIRNGFKDMTDIIPDLKDVNSSKSTILFKAVDFIKHLENRNRMLQEKANQLESRLMNQRGHGHSNGSGLDDKRLQDIPHIYPVTCSR
ncbi:hypothetical protein BG015_011699 [Linnemannia schmuckeri]|uniref:BHLH domain-containing protein n=1 Tax=Linnemannia schmuckeri TaxID=64567 RepID=A0A9P5RSN3_9FUNG|nr:hypothetical protein BG015_011699 [Linnemannia schmuckeri]